MSHGWDETWRRLLQWTGGQGPAERLAAQVLYAEGYERVDPSHPLGGPDGGKDARAHKDGLVWAMAAYFPRNQQSFADIKAKFLADVAKAGLAGAEGIAFVTNQELRLAERRELEMAIEMPLDLFHLEQITAVLDRPAMHGIRAQFLNMAAPAATPAPREPTWHDFLAAAPRTRGGPKHWMLYDGFLLMRTLMLPVPPGRHPEAAAPAKMLDGASQAAIAIAARWPASVSLLTRHLAKGWTASTTHHWAAGQMSSEHQQLVRRPLAAVAFDTRTGALAVERTWPTAIGEDDEPLMYRAAREPEVLAELLVATRLAGALLAFYDVPVDVACYIGAVGDQQGRLVSSQRAVNGPRFGEPVARVGCPLAEVPRCHLDSARFEIADLVDPFRAAEVLAGPWLATFRDDNLLAKLAADESAIGDAQWPLELTPRS